MNTNKNDKPKLTSEQLVSKLKDKGITFNYNKENEVADLFRECNNFLRITCYRKNYSKYQRGPKVGKYENLDFAYLYELSLLDMYIRYLLGDMCLDIEHALKVKLVTDSEKNSQDDGYTVVEDFINNNPHIIETLERNSVSNYTGDLEMKYFTIKKQTTDYGKSKNKIEAVDCPVWVFMELISFGDFIKFYDFYYKRFEKMPYDKKLLNMTRSLRNACAHNNCLLADLNKASSDVPSVISQRVALISTIKPCQRKKKLSSRVILEFAAVLYLYKDSVSTKISEHRIAELRNLINGRFVENRSFFKGNDLITSTYDFVYKLLNGIFPA